MYFYIRPKPPTELDEDSSVIEDDSELLLERVEEYMAADDSEEDEDNLLHIDDLPNIPNVNKVNKNFHNLLFNKLNLQLSKRNSNHITNLYTYYEILYKSTCSSLLVFLIN